MMGIFMAAMAAVMLLSGASIDCLNNQKIENQQTQPEQLTYISETADTINEPEQAAKKAWDKIRECTNACRQVAVLNGINSAEALCGAYGMEQPFSVSYTYEKCVNPEAVEGVTAEANKIIDDATTEFEAQWSTQEQQQSSRDVHVVVDMIHSRAKEHGLDLTTTCSLSEHSIAGKLLYCGKALEHALFDVKRVVNEGSDHWRNRHSCEWLTRLPYAKPFCEANKDFPGCEEFLDIYGNCEKILADAANKDEL